MDEETAMYNDGRTTSEQLYIPTLLIVGGSQSLLLRCFHASKTMGLAIKVCTVAEAQAIVPRRHPIAIIVPNDVFAGAAFDLAALARDVRSALLPVDPEVSVREIEAMIAAAVDGGLTQRERRSGAGRYSIVDGLEEESPFSRRSAPPASSRSPGLASTRPSAPPPVSTRPSAAPAATRPSVVPAPGQSPPRASMAPGPASTRPSVLPAPVSTRPSAVPAPVSARDVRQSLPRDIGPSSSRSSVVPAPVSSRAPLLPEPASTHDVRQSLPRATVLPAPASTRASVAPGPVSTRASGVQAAGAAHSSPGPASTRPTLPPASRSIPPASNNDSAPPVSGVQTAAGAQRPTGAFAALRAMFSSRR